MTKTPASEFRIDRILGACLLVIAAAYTIAALLAIFAWSPRVPYADQWRHYARLLGGTFPSVAFAADNGHVEILPNLARLIDLLWLGGSEQLQIALTAILVLASMAIWLRVVWRDPLPREIRIAQAAAIAVGMGWLGNMRALTQPCDGVHVYLVMVLAAFATLLALDVRDSMDWRKLIPACACCVVAALSFGSGIAAFAAMFALLLVQRAATSLWLVTIGAMLLGLCIYLMLAGTNGAPFPDVPVALLTTLRLLGAPFTYVFWPLLDPAAAARVPAPLHDFAVAAANTWTTKFGDVRTAAMPHALFGALAVLWLFNAVWRARRAGPSCPHSARFGIAVAGFGAAVCVLIALVRQDYFAVHVDQIVALRYAPWSSLCWCGLGVARLALSRNSRRALIATAVAAAVLLPSEIGMAVLARHVRDVAEDTALAAAVGVLPQEMPLGETDPVDVDAALPRLRTVRTAMFAWPEVELLGKTSPENAMVLDAQYLSIVPSTNWLGEPGRTIDAWTSARCAAPRLLVVDGDVVVGLVRHVSGDSWRGVARGARGEAPPSLRCP